MITNLCMITAKGADGDMGASICVVIVTSL